MRVLLDGIFGYKQDNVHVSAVGSPVVASNDGWSFLAVRAAAAAAAAQLWHKVRQATGCVLALPKGEAYLLPAGLVRIHDAASLRIVVRNEVGFTGHAERSPPPTFVLRYITVGN